MGAAILAILKAVFGVAFDQAVNLAVTAGIPWLIDWVYKNPKTPSWAKWLMDKINLTQLFIELVEKFKHLDNQPMLKSERVSEKKAVKKNVSRKCTGTACASETKGLD